MIINLSELARLAKEATPGKRFAHVSESHGPTVQIDRGWVFITSAKGTMEDCKLAAATDPDTVLALCEVVRAAHKYVRSTRERTPANDLDIVKVMDTFDALIAALANVEVGDENTPCANTVG